MKKTFTGESGVTLLELMFAAGVLAMALSLLFGSLINIHAVSEMSASRVVATTHVTTTLEEMQGMTMLDLLNYTPPEFTDLGSLTTVEVQVTNKSGNTVDIPVTGTPEELQAIQGTLPNPLIAKVTVTWQDNRGRTITATGVKTLYWGQL